MGGIDDAVLNFDAGNMAVLKAILAIVMFSIALDLSADDFRRVARAPRPLIVGLISQFLILPALTFVMLVATQPPPSVARPSLAPALPGVAVNAKESTRGSVTVVTSRDHQELKTPSEQRRLLTGEKRRSLSPPPTLLQLMFSTLWVLLKFSRASDVCAGVVAAAVGLVRGRPTVSSSQTIGRGSVARASSKSCAKF